MRELAIEPVTDSPVINLALDTMKIGKQALVFLGTRPSAEKSAEEVSRKVDMAGRQEEVRKLAVLADEVLRALVTPTRQCERLARCVRKGVAFHHSGLTAKQRGVVEKSFREGTVKVICCTPTLAAGVDLPAFRTIIRDLKRFTQQGYDWIPVMEYHQMAGRAGRPNYDSEGQAIIIASSEGQADELDERFISGEPEEVYSKLAVEPALRTYILSLIASRLVTSRDGLMEFFRKTFWAFQFRDMGRMESVIEKMLRLLEKWGFITISGSGDEFVSASDIGDRRISATVLGMRVAELYLDPLTGYGIMTGLKMFPYKGASPFTFLQLISFTPEMRPLLRVKAREQDEVQEVIMQNHSAFLSPEPSIFEPDYEDFLNSVKTAMFFSGWIDEKSEEELLEKFDIRPGEIRSKIANADWLLYAASELARILQLRDAQKEVVRLRMRVKHGAREELLPLLQLKGIGRVRSRMLFKNRIRALSDVKKADISTLTQILGSGKLAVDVKGQLGEEVKEVPKGTRKGQMSIRKF